MRRVIALFVFAPMVALGVTHVSLSPASGSPILAGSGSYRTADARLGRAEQDEDLSPPGCVEIVGKPLMKDCLPCPPLWLGDPSIRCLAPMALRLTSCPRLLVPPGRTIDSLVVDRLCGPSAGE